MIFKATLMLVKHLLTSERHVHIIIRLYQHKIIITITITIVN